MSHHIPPTQIPPMQRELLLAIDDTPSKALLRTRGGYAAAVGAKPAFTVRTVNAANRDWLVETVGPFASEVRLTEKGAAIVKRLRAAERDRAVAA